MPVPDFKGRGIAQSFRLVLSALKIAAMDESVAIHLALTKLSEKN
jgi:hypothetical protein